MIGTQDQRVERREITIGTQDGVAFPATLWLRKGAEPTVPAVLISSAAAVQHRFYRAFAEHLTRSGAAAVLAYDYRGVGSGARHPLAATFRMKDWGVLDLPAALETLMDAASGRSIVGLGHSFGGVALGLSNRAMSFQRYVTVASLNGWYRRTAEPVSVFMRMNAVGVPVTHLLGRLPKTFGLGTDLAGPIFRDWARWCRQPGFLFDDPDLPEVRHFRDVRLPLLSIGASDDPWGTPAAIEALLRHYEAATIHQHWFDPAETGHQIGHNGFFRRQATHTIWPVLTRFLLAGRLPDGSSV